MNLPDILAKIAFKKLFDWAKAHPWPALFLGILLLVPGLIGLIICQLELVADIDPAIAADLEKHLPAWLFGLVLKHHAYVQWGSLYLLGSALTAMFGGACGVFSPAKGAGLPPGVPPVVNPEPPEGAGELETCREEVERLKGQLRAMGSRKDQYKEHYFRLLCTRRLMLRALFFIPLVSLACLVGSWIYPVAEDGAWKGLPVLVSLGIDRTLLHAGVAAALVVLLAAIAGEFLPRSRKLNKIGARELLFVIVFSVFAANVSYVLISLGYERYFFESGAGGSPTARPLDELIQVVLFRLLILPAVAALGAQTMWHGLKRAPDGDPVPEDE